MLHHQHWRLFDLQSTLLLHYYWTVGCGNLPCLPGSTQYRMLKSAFPFTGPLGYHHVALQVQLGPWISCMKHDGLRH